MSTRIKSAAVAIVIAIIALILHNTFIFNLFIGFISVVAVFEIFRATGMDKFKYQAIACYVFAGLDALMPVFYKHGLLYFVSYRLYLGLYVLAMCILYLYDHKNFKYDNFFFMMGATVLLSYSFGTLINMSNMEVGGVFLIVLTLAGAWLADSGAYFVGRKFGKTHPWPEISPNKTLEGLIGGVVCNGIFLLIISFVYDVILKGASVRYVMVFFAGMACALIGLVGDLTASMIKRQTGIKDYGNIMPGHGGIMDRFDSVILVAPFMYYLISQGLILK
ncbi:phosphatidate cytidylyltransferase [uncultured Ruminococcus sp.]|uniref:phosphatidate cytidylyltransferase n=1 Tax=uncultured Ruminococcus sp. TaxID=165186 RepID=UPI0025D03D59|nr:phosphatidate cytidylyltransferase [uncultured Ruminococcus sp.]